MLSILLLALAAAEAACPAVSFEFTGQPACVALSFTGERIRLTNSCEAPVLVDQSVLLPDQGASPLVPQGTTTEIRDLNKFTMGVDGQLYRVVALFAEPEACQE